MVVLGTGDRFPYGKNFRGNLNISIRRDTKREVGCVVGSLGLIKIGLK